MLEAGEYLFARVGFSREETPVLSFAHDESFYDLTPIGNTITLRFSMTQRYCIGWSDITAGTRHACPNSNKIDATYEQCAACQQRTGFNPAFYHAVKVSSQQEARNTEPHMLYLAYFGKDTIKVGITHAARDRARLLEQGARYALILDVFPSAHIARSYEAKIAAIAGIAETIQLRKKLGLLEQTIPSAEATAQLLTVRDQIESQLGVTFAHTNVVSLDERYFPRDRPDFTLSHDCSDQHSISGSVTGMLGTVLFCQYDDTPVFLPLKKYIGYTVALSYEQTQLIIPARQTSLF